MTWTLHTDPEGEPTLWHDGIAILRRSDLNSPGWGVGTPGERAELTARLDEAWSVLTAGLAPDEATIERLAWIVKPEDERCRTCEESCSGCADDANEGVRRTLAALTDTPTQTRHTADIDPDQLHDPVEVE